MKLPRAIIEFDGKEINIDFENWSPIGVAQMERAWHLLQRKAHQERAVLLNNARAKERLNGTAKNSSVT